MGDCHQSFLVLLFSFLIETQLLYVQRVFVHVCVSTGTPGVAHRPGHQPSGQLPLHPGQQHCLTGKDTVTQHTYLPMMCFLNLFLSQACAFFGKQ